MTITPPSIMVAAAQYPLDEVASFAAWQDKIARWVGEGAATGADLLVFPEYGAIELAAAAGDGASADLERTLAATADLAPAADTVLAELAQHHRIHILGPSGPRRRDDGRFVNAARLAAPSGSGGLQEKLMMTPFERDWRIAPGSGLHVFETGIGRIGVAICYDCEFPLLVRALAEAGAEVVLVPSCTERLSGYHRVRAGAAARALESQIATVTAPTVGEALWSPAVDYNTGAAGVYVPPEPGLSLTGVLVEGRINEPGWIAARIDLALLRATRTGGEMRNREDWDRQPGASFTRVEARVVSLL